ncbi:uncharacterized protein [Musca autumnalis]|uniref:uncharacterized protein n=1 Tax=Musca autumnalis TaxID=221902 RepID=UPI003CF313B8
MSKIFVTLLLAATVLNVAKSDVLTDLMNFDQIDLSGFEILQILMKPDEPIDLKVGEIILNRLLHKMSKNGEDLNMKVDAANSFDMVQVITIDAQLSSNSEEQKTEQKCKVTVTLHLLTKNTGITFACEGQPTIEKEFPWN